MTGRTPGVERPRPWPRGLACGTVNTPSHPMRSTRPTSRKRATRITVDWNLAGGRSAPMTRRIALLSMAGALVLAASGPGEDDWREGVRHFSAEDFRQAQEAFEQAVAQDPESARFSLWLALAMGRRAERMTGLRKLAAAPLVRRMRREVERSVELDETNLDAYDVLQGFHLGAPALVGGAARPKPRKLRFGCVPSMQCEARRLWARITRPWASSPPLPSSSTRQGDSTRKA